MLHHYVGLALAALGMASAGLLPSFPRPWLGALGVAIALTLGVAARLGARLDRGRFAEACGRLQLSVLVIAGFVGVLAQWHFRTWPLATAAGLAVVAGLLAWRAWREASARLTVAVMVVLALMLPYLGCADMQGRAMRGNTMVFGLGVLSLAWIVMVGLRSTPTRLMARSTVLFVLGSFATAAMILRVLFERSTPPPPTTIHAGLDYFGPLLMTVALACAAYYSRSLVPNLMAAVVLVVLFPELQGSLEQAISGLSHGTGLGSAVIGVALVVLSLLLRRASWLARLGEGDRFLDGTSFPLTRCDHALFTLPLMGSAMFLLTKVDTYNLARRVAAGVPLKTAVALCMTGLGWTLVAVFLRRWPGAVIATHVGWLAFMVGILLGYRQLTHDNDSQWPLVITGLVLQAMEIAYRRWVARGQEWARELLAEPMRVVLEGGSAIAAAAAIFALWVGTDWMRLRWLAGFAAVELVRRAVTRNSMPASSLFFVLGLTATLAATAPGVGSLLERVSIEHSLLPVLLLVLVVQGVHLLVETDQKTYRRLRALLVPAEAGVVALVLGVGLFGLVEASTEVSLSLLHQVLLLAALLLTARMHATGPLALLGVLCAYVLVHFAPLRAIADSDQRLELLASPWRVALLSLVITILATLGRAASARWTRLVRSPFGFRALEGPVSPWLDGPALGIAVWATLSHSMQAGLRAEAAQTWAPFLAAAAFFVVALRWQPWALRTVAVILITTGHVHLVRFWFGSALRANGVPEADWLAAGIGLTLAAALAARSVARDEAWRTFLLRAALAGGTLILSLVTVSYLVNPGVVHVTPWRAALVGLLALGAGLAFRTAARGAGGDGAETAAWVEGAFHLGLVEGLWCAGLLVPALRHPETVLPALALPGACLWLLAEMARRHQTGLVRRYAVSATVVAGLVLVLSVHKTLFKGLLFPDLRPSHAHLHVNAALVMALGLLLLRLAGLLGRALLAHFGGTVVVVGSALSVTAWSGLSPFEEPFRAAWCGVVLGHLWVAVVSRGSPLRELLTRVAGLDEGGWQRWRRVFGLASLVTAQMLVMSGVLDDRAPEDFIAPLLLAGATVFVHIGLQWGGVIFFGLASAQLVAGLMPEPLSAWRLGAVALVVALLGEVARRRSRAENFAGEGSRGGLTPAWLHGPALALGLIAALVQTSVPDLRADSGELPASFLAGLAHLVVALSAGWGFGFGSASALFAVGNTHLVRFFLGAALEAQGLSDAHQVALGILITLLEATAVRAVVRRPAVAVFVNRLSLTGAALILVLLTANYFAHPDLAAMTPLRFIVSGIAALSAALYFRRAARRPGPGESAYSEVNEGLYHFGLAMAAWCAALTVPILRQPFTALLALGLPGLYFYARAEQAAGSSPELSRRYRNSAAVLGFVLLGLYAARPLFQMLFFPETRILTEHYHVNAALAMVLGVVLLRLRGLGGTEWLAFYGGLALVVGAYFALTAWPGLSPFEEPMAGAWCGVALVHFWTLVTSRRSPFALLVKQTAGLDEESWERFRRSWGLMALVGSQGLMVLGLLDYASDTFMVAPLLLGGASVVVHHGVIRKQRWYFVLAALQCVLALHADFVLPSYLPRHEILSVLLVLWAILLLLERFRPDALTAARLAPGAALLAALALAHVFYHHPASIRGLSAVAFVALLGCLTPREGSRAELPEEQVALSLLLVVPTWLAFFSQASILREGLAGAFHTRPIVCALLAFFLTSVAARWQDGREVEHGSARPLLWHQLLELLARRGGALHSAALVAVLGAGAFLQAVHYGRPYGVTDLWIFGLLWGGVASAWFFEGRRRQLGLAFVCAEASLAALFALVRRQLLLTTDFWTHEQDVWFGLAAGLVFTALKQTVDERRRETRLPVLGPLLVLPALTIVWTLAHGLGTDLTLVVVGLHSLAFAYLGRERRDSPYNLVAVSGFVSFVVLVFWSKLELRVLHAYAIPLGLGILVLVQLFGEGLPAVSRNRVRILALLGMLGSAGYHALLDPRYPVAFNVTLLLVCLAIMVVGSVVRLQIYLVLGFAGVVVDLVSLAAKAFVQMDRSARMTSVGALVLVLGAALVAATVYTKRYSEELEQRLGDIRARFSGWE